MEAKEIFAGLGALTTILAIGAAFVSIASSLDTTLSKTETGIKKGILLALAVLPWAALGLYLVEKVLIWVK